MWCFTDQQLVCSQQNDPCPSSAPRQQSELKTTSSAARRAIPAGQTLKIQGRGGGGGAGELINRNNKY